MGHALLTVNDRSRRGQDKLLSTLKAPASINLLMFISQNSRYGSLKTWPPSSMERFCKEHGQTLTGTQLRTVIQLTSKNKRKGIGKTWSQERTRRKATLTETPREKRAVMKDGIRE